MQHRYGYIHHALLVGTAIVAILLASVTKTERTVAGPDDFTLSLQAEHTTIAQGQDLPISALITNASAHDVLLVPTLDGSDSMRYPQVHFQITKPDNAPTTPTFSECGFSNDITIENFVKVSKQENFEPLSELSFISAFEFTAPGIYTIEVLYSTDADIDEWRGGFGGGRWINIPYLFSFQLPEGSDGSLKRLLNQVPKMSLKSNIVTVTVVDSPHNQTSANAG